MVTDGSAVLGLGNLGPYAAMPVMEGKAALFKRFAGIDAWPICLDSQDTDEIVADGAAHRARVRRDQPGGHQRAAVFRGGAQAPRAARHPGVPRRPARHGDRGAGRADERAAGGGQEASARCASPWPARAPPGTAVLKLLLGARGQRTTSWSATTRARCTAGRADLDESLRWIAENTNRRRLRGRPGRGRAGRRRVHRAVGARDPVRR